MKTCKDCGEVQTPSGGRCPGCRREYLRRYREQRRRERPNYFKQHYAQNRERRKQESREYSRQHVEANRARVKKWREDHPDRALASQRSYRANNPAYRKRWTTWINWRQRGDNAPSATTLAYAEVLRADPCSYCGSSATEIDHIEPMARGGRNAWSNLTASCRSCNRQKSAKPLLTFLLDRP